MDGLKENNVGRFSVEVELVSDRDLARAESGVIRPDEVRRVRVPEVVDTGATRCSRVRSDLWQSVGFLQTVGPRNLPARCSRRKMTRCSGVVVLYSS
jgi:hypothetical protein